MSLTFKVEVSHTVHELVTDIILNITSPEDLISTYCISVGDYSNSSVKKQAGMH